MIRLRVFSASFVRQTAGWLQLISAMAIPLNKHSHHHHDHRIDNDEGDELRWFAGGMEDDDKEEKRIGMVSSVSARPSSSLRWHYFRFRGFPFDRAISRGPSDQLLCTSLSAASRTLNLYICFISMIIMIS